LHVERQGLAAGSRSVGGPTAVMRVSSWVQLGARNWSNVGRQPSHPFGPSRAMARRRGRGTLLRLVGNRHQPRTFFAAGIAASLVGIVIATSVLLGPPNTRLKLAAPVLYNDGVNQAIRCRSITFVKLTAWRRSLSAIR
jgi:hypothetical protein